MEKRHVTGETAQGRQNSAQSSPCAARHPPKQHRLRQPRILERYSLAPSGEGIGAPHPSGLPAAPSPLCTAPKMPPGVKSLMASQEPSWPSFTSISLVSLRRTAAGRGRESPVSAGLREGEGHRGHLDPPTLTRRLRHLDVPEGTGRGGSREEGRAGIRAGRGRRHVRCVTAPCWVCHDAMLGVSLPPKEGSWRSRSLLEPVQPVLETGQGVMNTNWEWGKFGLEIQK